MNFAKSNSILNDEKWFTGRTVPFKLNQLFNYLQQQLKYKVFVLLSFSNKLSKSCACLQIVNIILGSKSTMPLIRQRQ